MLSTLGKWGRGEGRVFVSLLVIEWERKGGKEGEGEKGKETHTHRALKGGSVP